MMFRDELYQKSVAENKKNLTFWETYLNDLKSLDFGIYTGKLKVPILVPIGNRILFRGELKHTNEVTVSLGADYFVKCSVAQAEILKQNRIKDAQSKVDLYRGEKEYLENRITFTKEKLFDKDCLEILEEYSEAEDKAWREIHKKNVKKYKAKENIEPKDEVSDASLWERLEELELQEELENELLDNYNEIVDHRKGNTFLEKEEALLRNSFKEEKEKYLPKNDDKENIVNIIQESHNNKDIPNNIAPEENSKHDLLQKVLDKQNELENKLHELKHKEREQIKTEQDLISHLEEMEQLDNLEDEMERLDDILVTGDVETMDTTEDEDIISESKILKKSISFADESDGETLEITFTHTETEPNSVPYNPKNGITKPSDLYEAYSQLFNNKTISILKKSKYELEENVAKALVKPTKQVVFEEKALAVKSDEAKETLIDKAIVIKDVVEKVGVNQHNIEGEARPTSLFKKKRMQNK